MERKKEEREEKEGREKERRAGQDATPASSNLQCPPKNGFAISESPQFPLEAEQILSSISENSKE